MLGANRGLKPTAKGEQSRCDALHIQQVSSYHDAADSYVVASIERSLRDAGLWTGADRGLKPTAKGEQSRCDALHIQQVSSSMMLRLVRCRDATRSALGKTGRNDGEDSPRFL